MKENHHDIQFILFFIYVQFIYYILTLKDLWLLKVYCLIYFTVLRVNIEHADMSRSAPHFTFSTFPFVLPCCSQAAAHSHFIFTHSPTVCSLLLTAKQYIKDSPVFWTVF